MSFLFAGLAISLRSSTKTVSSVYFDVHPPNTGNFFGSTCVRLNVNSCCDYGLVWFLTAPFFGLTQPMLTFDRNFTTGGALG